MFDSCGREIYYLRISVTDRCNMRCVYCMPEDGVHLLRHEEILGYEQMARIAEVAARLGFRKLRITGGEPLVRKGLENFVRMLRRIPGIETIGMTTNGTLLAPVAGILKDAGLDSVNVSLDTMDPVKYARFTRGGDLSRAREGIEAALAVGLPVKLNVVVMDGTDEDVAAVSAYAEGLGARIQTIARYHLDETKMDYETFDRPPKCGNCNRLRLLANGFLRPCLHGAAAVKVDLDNIEHSIRTAVLAKPPRGESCTDLEVGQIGG